MRVLPKPDKHPAIFAAYARLPVGESFVVVNNHRRNTCARIRCRLRGKLWLGVPGEGAGGVADPDLQTCLHRSCSRVQVTVHQRRQALVLYAPARRAL